MLLTDGDEDAIKQVLINIISNCIKFSQEHKYLRIDTSQSRTHHIITIQDKGIGMSDEQKAHVFEAFYRGTDKKVTRIGGAGIGLTIVFNVMEAHGGTVQIESKPGLGTSVSLSLPKQRVIESHQNEV
jgi:two-component system sensor histidine kinase VicK